MIGNTLSHYKIIEKIGQGGQGEVYLAEDSRLDRKVALKILPQHLSERAELRERFEREARAVSSLNHPHICTLHDIGEQDGIHYLVMEHLVGETLEARLAKGPLPLEQTLEYAIQIADALDKAHRQGVVHRDLKPGNIMLVKSGAKLLDFGLAKLQAAETPTNLSALPTEQANLTAEGTILGTLQYMAPEQLEAKEADSRTDIFAFGAVVYEMATGKKAFEGKSQASLIAAIIGQDPRPMAELQPMTPSTLDWVVKRCLQKGPDERVQSAGDLVAELRWVIEVGTQLGTSPAPAPPVLWKRAIPWSITAVVTGVLILGLLYFRTGTEISQIVLSSVLPPGQTVFDSNAGPMALSPDGQLLAFVARTPEEKRMLWVRPLDSESAQLLPGTENAFAPFWSPDSNSLGFFANDTLKTIDASGGTVETLVSSVDSVYGPTGTWNQEGIILFGNIPDTGIHRVRSSGGTTTPVTTIDGSLGEVLHGWPFFLPDGNHFLYLARTRSSDQPDQIYLSSLDGKEPTPLLSVNSNAIYAAPGFLLFWRDGALRAQRFNTDGLQVIGESFPVAPDVRFNAHSRSGLFSVSQNGILAYQSGGQTGLSQLVWFDRAGNQLDPVGSPGNYFSPRLSNNGRQVAVDESDLQNNGDIWLYELSRSAPSRFTFDPGDDSGPVWSPDDSRIVFFSSRTNPMGELYQKTVGTTDNAEALFSGEFSTFPTDWSSDGRFVAFQHELPGNYDIWVFSVQDQEATPFMETRFNESHGQFSPDGKWMVYVSEESGQSEIYIQPFPKTGAKWPVSTTGGRMPRWGADGRELFYVALDQRLVRVQIATTPEVEIGVPQPLFVTRIKFFAGALPQYDVAEDSQSFLINTMVADEDTASITLVLNWFEELKRLSPTDN
jgi:serine/threonine protein kinase